MAIEHAITHKRKSVTLVHKGNIMKYTEGAFRTWGYEVARDEYPGQTIGEKEVDENTAAWCLTAKSSSKTVSPMPCSSKCYCARRNTTSSPRRT